MTFTLSYTNTFVPVSASINIVNRSLSETFPEMVTFEIDTFVGFDTLGPTGGNIYNPRHHDLYYLWDFGDGYTFTAPEKLLTQNFDSRYADGPKVSHTYRAAGTYNVSCIVIEPATGRIATATMAVVVGAEDYSGTRTVFVDSTGVGTGAPAGSTVVTTLEAAWSNVFNGTPNIPRQIVIKRDQTFTPSSLVDMGRTANRMSVLIRAEDGAGAQPILNMTSAGLVFGSAIGATVEIDIRFQNLTIVGLWDAANSDTSSGFSSSGFAIDDNRPNQTLFDGCTIDGFGICIYPRVRTAITGNEFICINDTVITNWATEGIFGAANWAGAGVRLMQKLDALQGFAGSGTSVGPCARLPASPIVIFTQSDFYNRIGWGSAVTGYFDNQGCIRGATESYLGTGGAFYNINGCAMEAGFGVFGFDTSDPDLNGDTISYPINCIMEKNVIVGEHGSTRIGGFSPSGITFRNNVCILPDTPRVGYGLGGLIRCESIGADAENLSTPINIYSNTFVTLVDNAEASGGVVPLFENLSSFSSFTVVNNIDLQPNRGGTDLTNIDTTVLWAPRYNGYEDDDTALDTSLATPANTVSLYALTATVAASGTPVAYDSITAGARGNNPDQGASQFT